MCKFVSKNCSILGDNGLKCKCLSFPLHNRVIPVKLDVARDSGILSLQVWNLSFPVLHNGAHIPYGTSRKQSPPNPQPPGPRPKTETWTGHAGRPPLFTRHFGS